MRTQCTHQQQSDCIPISNIDIIELQSESNISLILLFYKKGFLTEYLF